MKRRTFISKAALVSVMIGGLSVDRLLASGASTLAGKKVASTYRPLNAALQADFDQLILWLKDNRWLDHLSAKQQIQIDPAAGMAQYFRPITVIDLPGYDDFGGQQLIQPGFPAGSLLYHMLASPRIQPENLTASQYPTLEKIDLLENLIFALADYPVIPAGQQMTLAVFAYEYRPAFKTPHHQHADLVFSRTGIARIGETDLHYDARNRCFTNLPATGDTRKAAVTAVRYGVFLCKVQTGDGGITQVSRAAGETDNSLQFLVPVRKVFDNDDLIHTNGIKYQERHISEKLKSLLTLPDLHFQMPYDATGAPMYDLEKYPFKMDSGKGFKLVDLQPKGSSVQLSAVPAKLIDYAKQDGKLACLHVDRHNHTYFSAMNTIGIEDIEVIKSVQRDRMNREVNFYDHPRQAPLFVNVKHIFKVDYDQSNVPDMRFDETKISHRSGVDADDTNNGHVPKPFFAALFVDLISDGCVTADVRNWSSAVIPNGVLTKCLPAFSIVTAPDFFQLADTIDLKGFDDTAIGHGTNFYEGGLYNLSAERTPPNQKIEDPVTNLPAFAPTVAERQSSSMLAVYGSPLTSRRTVSGTFGVPSSRNYHSTSFLPDVCSGIFAPGWDITYASDAHLPERPYLSTRGLGSPFPEDMKLCAAMNGMWPAASPDASRTYQGGLNSGDRNPTAIPLLDTEIGLHKDSAAFKDYHQGESTGWDGEQGPFLELSGNLWKVNFADLARTDTVKNTLDGKLDFSRLRDLTSAELRRRMACLALCIRQLPKKLFRPEIVIPGTINDELIKTPALTALWLVSAEAVNWPNPAAGWGIPKAFAGRNLTALITPHGQLNGPGYLYVFALTDFSCPTDMVSNRRSQTCTDLFICQVTENKLNWTKLPSTGAAGLTTVSWQT